MTDCLIIQLQFYDLVYLHIFPLFRFYCARKLHQLTTLLMAALDQSHSCPAYTSTQSLKTLKPTLFSNSMLAQSIQIKERKGNLT